LLASIRTDHDELTRMINSYKQPVMSGIEGDRDFGILVWPRSGS
jgi:hypothetical protein